MSRHTVLIRLFAFLVLSTLVFVVALTSPALAECPEGMISYWKLEETSGAIYDDYYYVNDGVCAAACPTPTIGKIDGGQTFNESTTGIDVPADLSFDWGATDSFSIEYWMKRVPGILADNEVIVGRDDSNTLLHWWTGIWSEGEAAFVLMATNGDGSGTDDLYLHGTTDLTDGSWHHIVVVRDASTEKNILYVDGREEASVVVTYSAGFDSVTAALNIGWLNFGGGYHFGGTLDELALYDRALPDVEVQQHYFNGQAEYGYCTVFAPEIISTAVTEATVGRLYTYDVNAAGNPAPIYALEDIAPDGMIIDSQSGLISWSPDVADDFGVTVIATNEEVPNASQAFTITVTVNDAPVAIDDAYSGVDEGGTLIIDPANGVLDNDSDTENDPLTAVLVDSVSHGTLSLNADGSFTYTHDGTENTSDSFTYKANDGIDDSNIATVTITIDPVNDAPVAIDDAYSGVDEGGTLIIDPANGVLDNDSDTENDPLTAVLVDSVSHGTLSLNADGSFTYTHDGTENTSDSFTYKANDGIDDSNVATVSITIDPVNDAPVAIDDAYSGVDEGGTLIIDAASGVLANDSDTENDPLTAVLVDSVSHGTLSLNADDGSFTYTHDGTENTSDSFTYRARDGIADSNVATVTITIIPRPISLPGVLLLLL